MQLDLRTAEEIRHDKMWPKGKWINDGHRVSVNVPGDGESPEVELDLIHPNDCPHKPHEWGYREYLCPIGWETDQIGLSHPGDSQEGRKWRDQNWDDSIPSDDYMAFFRARHGDDVMIEYWYHSGYDEWSGEYDWEFTWRPVELARLHDLR